MNVHGQQNCSEGSEQTSQIEKYYEAKVKTKKKLN